MLTAEQQLLPKGLSRDEALGWGWQKRKGSASLGKVTAVNSVQGLHQGNYHPHHHPASAGSAAAFSLSRPNELPGQIRELPLADKALLPPVVWVPDFTLTHYLKTRPTAEWQKSADGSQKGLERGSQMGLKKHFCISSYPLE